MATANQEYTGAELARLLNVTGAAVTAWKAQGCPCRMKSGRPLYVVHDVVPLRLERAADAAVALDILQASRGQRPRHNARECE